MLAVVDDYSRECLALVADTSLSGHRVVRELDAVIARRGRPAMVVSDNGTELTSMAILSWCQRTGIEWHYIAPGKPMQNGFVESFRAGRPGPTGRWMARNETASGQSQPDASPWLARVRREGRTRERCRRGADRDRQTPEESIQSRRIQAVAEFCRSIVHQNRDALAGA